MASSPGRGSFAKISLSSPKKLLWECTLAGPRVATGLPPDNRVTSPFELNRVQEIGKLSEPLLLPIVPPSQIRKSYSMTRPAFVERATL
jgi:hypothetical protein